MKKQIIQSYSFDEQEIIKNILALHCGNKMIDIDPTYGNGNFYNKGIRRPHFVFDINPTRDWVVKANAENIPLPNECANTIMFDPPFLATKGKSLTKDDDSNKINKRFTVYPTENELFCFYINALSEFWRLLREDGILIFKCQDKVSSSKQYWSHVFIINEAEKSGFYCKDLFILLKKQRIVADWQRANQQHARKHHSYFIVLQKTNKRVKYYEPLPESLRSRKTK